MALIDESSLTAAVSTADPCGPDLEVAGHSEYMTFMARAEGLLPAVFFSGPDGKPFDRLSIDVATELETAKPFLQQTRDLRLLALLAKLCLLNRDIDGFLTFISAIRFLLEQYWETVHPRGETGDFGIRTAVLETLDDMAPVILPLQYAPLIENRRLGPVTFRQFMFTNGDAQPREEEEQHDRAALEKAMMEAELPVLIARRDLFESLRGALATIQKITGERTNGAQAVRLEKLAQLVEKIFHLLNNFVGKREPSAALTEPQEAEPVGASEGQEGAQTPPPAAIKCNADAGLALAAAARYFSRYEPSNPALLLVRQAEQLMGKSFLEVMQILVPGHVEQAKIQIGKDQGFDIPVERLSPFASIEAPQANVVNGGGEHANGVEGQAPSSTVEMTAETRQQAFALLDQIGAYYRKAEPSSPIAFITERARSLGERDFLSLLRDLLPAAPSS